MLKYRVRISDITKPNISINPTLCVTRGFKTGLDYCLRNQSLA